MRNSSMATKVKQSLRNGIKMQDSLPFIPGFHSLPENVFRQRGDGDTSGTAGETAPCVCGKSFQNK